VEGALPDRLAHPVIEVHAGGKGDVHPVGTQLRGHEPAEGAAEGHTAAGIEVEFVADAARRGQPRESRAEALHAPALLVHRHDQRG
jgi:hypothetical protein